VPADQVGVLFLSLILPLNMAGELQVLHDPCCCCSSGEAETAALSSPSVTHFRVAWGQHERDVAVAVLQEHTHVPLRSLAEGDAAREVEIEPHSSGWFEYCGDTKKTRKNIMEMGGPVYTAERPYQVLVPHDTLAPLLAPLEMVSLQDSSRRAKALASLMQRSEKPGNDPGRNSSGAFGCVDTSAASVAADELEATLQPFSSFALAVAVAATTFVASRLAFLSVSMEYLSQQDPTVSGLEVLVHMVRSGDRDGDGHELGAEQEKPRSATRRSAVAAPASPRIVLVVPRHLTFGLLPVQAQQQQQQHQGSASAPAAINSWEVLGDVVDARALYSIITYTSCGGQFIMTEQPPTELLEDLRIASLWGLWLWYGFTASRSSTLTPECGDATQSSKEGGRRELEFPWLLVRKEIGVLTLRSLQPPSTSESNTVTFPSPRAASSSSGIASATQHGADVAA
jgi:hypothetical protein